MRTIRTKVYQFSELSEQAKEKAIEDYRSGDIDTDYIYDEAHETVKEFHKIFGTKEGGRSWLEVSTSEIDDNICDLKGLRLQKYIWNNFGKQLYKGKYYGLDVDRQIFHKRVKSERLTSKSRRVDWFNAYYSAITFENSCVLTGVCYDDSLLQPVYDFLENYRDKADYYSYMDFTTLMDDCFASLEKDIESEVEAQNEDEQIIDNIEANEYEFTKEGKRFYK